MIVEVEKHSNPCLERIDTTPDLVTSDTTENEKVGTTQIGTISDPHHSPPTPTTRHHHPHPKVAANGVPITFLLFRMLYCSERQPERSERPTVPCSERQVIVPLFVVVVVLLWVPGAGGWPFALAL